MKLMQQQEAKIAYSQQKLYEYLTTSTVISSEAVTDYFAKLKDILNAAIGLIYTPYNDKAVADILRHKHEVIEKAKHLDFTATWGSSRVDLQACKLGTGRRFTTS
jgi:hypothetical protein